MKLIKKICKQCNLRSGYEWSEQDEGYWRKGIAFCPMDNELIRKINIECEKPPEHCQYAAEQLVSQNHVTR